LLAGRDGSIDEQRVEHVPARRGENVDTGLSPDDAAD